MELSYFDKLSPYGVRIEGLGRISSPFLRDIAKIGYRRYSYYIELLAMQPRDFFARQTQSEDSDNLYDLLPEQEKQELTMFRLLTSNEAVRDDLAAAFELFLDGRVVFKTGENCFVVNETIEDGVKVADGRITERSYDEIAAVCLQLVCVQGENAKSLKFKNERARRFYEKFQKKKREAAKSSKPNRCFELANIVSVLAGYSESVNYHNIWGLTVYQVYDLFKRQQRKNQTAIRDHNYAVWGGEYSPEEWMKRIDTQQE